MALAVLNSLADIIRQMELDGKSEEEIKKVVAEHKRRNEKSPVETEAEIEPVSDTVNVDGSNISLTQEKEIYEDKSWINQINNSLNSKQEIAENPILNKDGSPNVEATQQNIDNVSSPIAFIPKQPSGIVIDAEIDYETELGLSNNLTQRNQARGIRAKGLPEAEQALEILNNKFNGLNFEFEIKHRNLNADIKITAPNGESLTVSPIANNDKEIQNFIKENSEEYITQEEIIDNKQLLIDYQAGKIDLTAEKLFEIVEATPEAKAHVMQFMPKFEDIKEGINPKTKESYITEEYLKAINKAYQADPRTIKLTKNIGNEIENNEEFLAEVNNLELEYIDYGIDKEEYDLLSQEATELKMQIEDPKFIENINKEWQKRVDWMQGQCQKWGIYCEDKWYRSNPEFGNHPLVREFNNKVDQINEMVANRTSEEDLNLMVEKYQVAVQDLYNKKFQKALIDNPEAARIYKEYGVIAEKLMPDVFKGHARMHDPRLKSIDQRMEIYSSMEDMNIIDAAKRIFTNIRGGARGENIFRTIPQFERGKANIDENFIQFKESVWYEGKFWNEMEISLRAPRLKNRNRVVENLKQQIKGGPFLEGGAGLDLNMKVGEARKLDNNGQLNRYLVAYRGTRDDDLTVGEFLDQRESDLNETMEANLNDYDQMIDAYGELAKLNKLEVTEDFLSVEGFMQHLGMGLNQATHMVPSLLGSALMAGGTAMSVATGGIATPVASGLMWSGGILMAAGATIQGAMTYSSVYMEGVRRQMQNDPKYAGREITPQEFFEALQDPKYGDQLAAIGAGASVMGSEFFSDLIFSKVGGKMGGFVFDNPTMKTLMRNGFQKYLINAVTGFSVYKLGQWKEWGTEGFQDWLEQGFTNAAVGQENPFTSNIDFDQILESAEGGWVLGRLMGVGTAGGALFGQSQMAGIMMGSYTNRAKAIVSKLKINPESKTSKTVEALFKELKKEIENDPYLNKEQKREELERVSNVRNAGLTVPIHVNARDRKRLVELLMEQKNLENQIKQTNNKQISIVEINRKKEVDAEIEKIIQEADILAKSLEGDTVAQGIVPTGSKGENIDTLGTEYKDGNIGTSNMESLLNQYEKIALKALGFDSQKGTVKREDAVSFVNKHFNQILEGWDPSKGSLSTYITANIKPKKSAFYGAEQQLDKKGKSTRLSDERAQELQAEETQETQGKEFEKKKYPTDIAAIEKQTADVRPEILTNIKTSVKQFIASSVGKVKEIGGKGKKIITKLDPSSLAKELKAQNKATKAAVRKAMGKSVKAQNDFIKKAINDGYIETIPIAAMKKRFKTVKGFNIEKIGREKGTAAGTGIYKLSGLNKQALIDFYTKDQSGRRSFIDLLAKGLTIEQFQEMKTDKDFMKDLSISLEEAGVEMTAEEFIDEVERTYDGRIKEKRSLDVIIEGIDKSIETVEKLKADPNVLGMNMGFLEAGRQTIVLFLRGIKAALQEGLSFVQALERGAQQIKDLIAVTIKQEQIVDNTIGTLTEIDIDNYEIVQQKVDEAFAQVAKDKYNNVSDYEINRIKKLLKRRNISNDAKQIILKNFLQFINTSYQKNTQAHQLWQGDNAQAAYKYWEKQLGVKLSDYGFTLSVQGKRSSILLNGEKLINTGPLRPSNAPTNIAKIYKKSGIKGALKYIKDNIASSDKNSIEAKNYIVETLGDLIEAGEQDVAIQLLDIMGGASDSALRMVGTIRSIQDNVKADKNGDIKVEYEHTPPIATIREKIRNVLKTNQNVESAKQQIREILDESHVDIIGKQEAKKLNDTKEKGGLGRKTTGENLSRYDGAVNQKNLVMIERSPDAVIESEKKAKKKINKLAPTITNKDQTTTQTKETLENSLDTQVNAQKVNKKKKGISVFDLDDTLAKTKEQVLVKMPDGTLRRLTPAQFAEQADILAAQGAEFDFSQFKDVKGAKKGPLADLALRRQDKFGSGDIYILTARPQASAQNIKLFLDSIGLNIPIENIIGLENGSSQAKADWILQKTKEGYNDFYFADDQLSNVKAVKQILDQVDVKSKVQQAIADKEINLDKEFNEMLEETTGLKAQAEYSETRARLEGKKKDKGFFKWLGDQLTITPSAEDFLGLMYDLMGYGEQGNRHAKWIRDNLIDPFNKAEQEILSAKVAVANDFAALKKAYPSLKSKGLNNPLMNEIGVGPYTKSQAMRVYMWTKQGMEIPGLSKRDQNALVKAVENDVELMGFADNVMLIAKSKQYPAPGDNWIAGTIDTDLMNDIDTNFRRKAMTEFDENTKIIFSDKNMNKLEALYGKKWVDALKDSLRRMKSGSNRPVYQGGGARIVNEMLDWLNGSVGAIMFVNMRSGLLQLISNINFINWGDNNIYAAAKAFASKDYFPTVIKLLNSDYLVNRRDGLKINVNEAELVDAGRKGGFKGMVNYLLDKGFIITRIMDSLAIATGGATFFINRKATYLKRINQETGKKYTEAEAEAKAFDDFYAISEETQQSSNPSKISQQQASLAGRVILSFQNVTMQYNRRMKKSIRDLYNRRKNPGMTQRESDLSNISQIVYYSTVQNIVFHSLQQTLFALLFNDETDDEEKTRAAKILNGMADSLLFGLGFGGAVISTVKNIAMVVASENEKKSPDYEEAVWEVFGFSPVLDSKIRKLRTTAKTFNWNMEEIQKRGWSLDNPTYLALAQLVSAATNLPVDRVLRKTMNLRAAMDEETRAWQRVALVLGWDTWSVGLPYWGLQSTIKQEEKAKEKAKVDYKNDIRKLKAQGYKKVMYRNLKDFDSNDIVELESPAGTVVYYVKIKKK